MSRVRLPLPDWLIAFGKIMVAKGLVSKASAQVILLAIFLRME